MNTLKIATLGALAAGISGATPARASISACATAWKSTGGGNCATAVAVCMAESGGNPSARNVNSDSHHSVDRGLWQVNNYWHPEVSDSCAFSSGCNAKAALKISSGGSNWSPWATYNGGAYKSHLSAARSACGELAPQEAGVAQDVVERPPVIVVPPRTAELAQCLPNGEYCSNSDPCCGSCSWGTCGDSTDEKEAQDDAWDAAHRFGPGGQKRYGPGGGIQRVFGPGATEPVKPDVPPHVNEAQGGGEPASCTHKLKQLCGHCGGDKGCWLSCAKSHKGQLLAAGCHPPQSEEKEVATEAQVGGEPASCTQKLTQLCGHCGSDKSCWLSCAKQNKGALIAAGCKPPQVSDSCSRCKANWATGVLKGEIEALGMDSDYFDCDSSPACQKEVRDEITKKLRGPEAKCSGSNCVDCGVAIAGCSLACAVAFPEGCISCITGYGGCCRCGSEHFGYDCKYC
jgi:hypothetical protein